MSIDAPDNTSPSAAEDEQPTRLTYTERKQARMQMRVEKWEERLNSPAPPRYWHRAIITVIMMLAMLVLLYLLLFGGPPA